MPEPVKHTALSLFFLGLSLQAGTVAVSDNTFGSGWTTQVVYTTVPENSASGNQTASGGNPGEFYTVEHSYNGEMVVGNLSSLVLDPSLYGGFSSLSYAYDYIKISSTWAPGAIATSFVIYQNSAWYYAAVTDFAYTNLTWQSKSMSGLTASQFSRTYLTLLPGPVDAPANPDFSAAGAPMQFGFFTANSSGFPISSSHGYDNFSVTATYPSGDTPEPGTAALLAAAGVALLWLRPKALYHRLKCNAERSLPPQAVP